MCRLFGFRSVIEGQVHRSLVHADEALMAQSEEHPDGWGVAYYIHDSPHVIKSTNMAKKEALFQKVSEMVLSKTVLAHLRKSTVGRVHMLNTHPFQFGPWVFAHNGNIKYLSKLRPTIISAIDQKFQRAILGDTDSELLFFFLLGHLERSLGPLGQGIPSEDLVNALKVAIRAFMDIVGPCSEQRELDTETFLTFLLTNGSTFVAHQGGKELFYSTYKTRCPQRETCPEFSLACEAPMTEVTHFIAASQAPLSENIWTECAFGQIIGVDDQMKIFSSSVL